MCDPVLFFCAIVTECRCNSLHFNTLTVLHCRLDCLRKVLQGIAEFGMFQAEDIVVASSYKNPDVLITNEIRIFDSKCRFNFFDFIKIKFKRKFTRVIIKSVLAWSIEPSTDHLISDTSYS
jgi:hypothetical protein